MHFMSVMEHTLQAGTPEGGQQYKNDAPHVWPREFRDPVDAALHLGTPCPPQSKSTKPMPLIRPDFFD